MNPSLPGLPLQNLKQVHTAAIKTKKKKINPPLESSFPRPLEVGFHLKLHPASAGKGRISPMTACLDVQMSKCG